MKKFSEKLKEQRQKLNMTQEELANLVGVSKRTIIKYENDGVKPRPNVLDKLAKALKVSAEYLDIDEIQDSSYKALNAYKADAEKEVSELLERNAALFAGGELSQEAKDTYFQAVMEAYLTCKKVANEKKGQNQE